MARIEKSCENCIEWMPFGGGCALGGFMPCDKWKLSLSYKQEQELTLWD